MRYREATKQIKVLLVVSPTGSKLWVGNTTGYAAFGTTGDSGSLVYYYDGRVIGLYIGGRPNDVGKKTATPYGAYYTLGGIYFVTPINAALDDIGDTMGRLYSEYGNVGVNMLWG